VPAIRKRIASGPVRRPTQDWRFYQIV